MHISVYCLIGRVTLQQVERTDVKNKQLVTMDEDEDKAEESKSIFPEQTSTEAKQQEEGKYVAGDQCASNIKAEDHVPSESGEVM